MIRLLRKTITISALILWPLTPLVFAQNPGTTSNSLEILPSFQIAQSGKPVKCGLDDIMYLRQNMAAFSIARQNELKSSLARPRLPSSFISPSGIFKIHYSTTGVHRVDSTSTNNQGVPDYVWEAALAADQSHQLLVETLGFNAHLSDNGIDGPEFDIYIVNTRSIFPESYYGATTPEERAGNGWTSYIAVENDFQENFFTKGLDALRVTVAHEYFHAIHFSYYFRDEDIFFYEMSSTWFEDEAYPEVNDYLQYLPQLFRTLDDPLHKKDGWHEYGSALFLKYWLSTHERTSLRKMWEGMVTQQAVRAIEDEILAQGSSFVQAMAEYSGWCIFTNDRAQFGQFFEDAVEFPSVEYRDTVDVLDDTTLTDSTRALSAQFYQFTVDASKDFNVTTTGSASGIFGLAGAPKVVMGQPAQLLVRSGFLPYSITAAENTGTIYLAVVNGAPPENPSASIHSLKREVYNLTVSLRAVEPQPVGLLAPRPNPFLLNVHSKVVIPYNLSETAEVSWVIVSEAGQFVIEKDLGRRTPGIYQFVWDGKDEDDRPLASGIYLIILTTSSGGRYTQKIALVR